jgi:hypothetical protein
LADTAVYTERPICVISWKYFGDTSAAHRLQGDGPQKLGSTWEKFPHALKLGGKKELEKKKFKKKKNTPKDSKRRFWRKCKSADGRVLVRAEWKDATKT